MAKAKGQYIIEVTGTGNAEAVIRRVATATKEVDASAGRAGAEFKKMQGEITKAQGPLSNLKSALGGLPLQLSLIGAAIAAGVGMVKAAVAGLKEGAQAVTNQRLIDALPDGAKKVQAALQGLQDTMDTTSVQGFVLKMNEAGLSAEQMRTATGFALAYSKQMGQDLQATMTQVTQAAIAGATGTAKPFRTFGIVAKDAKEAFDKMDAQARQYALVSIGDIGIRISQMETRLANADSDLKAAAARALGESDETVKSEQAALQRSQEIEASLRARASLRAAETGADAEAIYTELQTQEELFRLRQDEYALEQKIDRESIYGVEIRRYRAEYKAIQEKIKHLEIVNRNIRLILDNQDSITRFWENFGSAGKNIIEELQARISGLFRVRSDDPGAKGSLLGDVSKGGLDWGDDGEGDLIEGYDPNRPKGGGRRRESLPVMKPFEALPGGLSQTVLDALAEAKLSEQEKLLNKIIDQSDAVKVTYANFAKAQLEIAAHEERIAALTAQVAAEKRRGRKEGLIGLLNIAEQELESTQVALQGFTTQIFEWEDVQGQFVNDIAETLSKGLDPEGSLQSLGRDLNQFALKLEAAGVEDAVAIISKATLLTRDLRDAGIARDIASTTSEWSGDLLDDTDTYKQKLVEMYGNIKAIRQESFILDQEVGRVIESGDLLQISDERSRIQNLTADLIDLAATRDGIRELAQSFADASYELSGLMTGAKGAGDMKEASSLAAAMGFLADGAQAALSANDAYGKATAGMQGVVNAGKVVTSAFVDDYETRAAIMAAYEFAMGVMTAVTPGRQWESPGHFLAASLFGAMAAGAWKSSGSGASGGTESYAPPDLTRPSDSAAGGGNVYIVIGGDLVAGDASAGEWTARMLAAYAENGGHLDPRLSRFRN